MSVWARCGVLQSHTAKDTRRIRNNIRARVGGAVRRVRSYAGRSLGPTLEGLAGELPLEDLAELHEALRARAARLLVDGRVREAQVDGAADGALNVEREHLGLGLGLEG